MATKAYFKVDIAEKFCQDSYQTILRDLETIPEVKSVERVIGSCDLLVKVDVPIRMIFVANKIRSKKWVKGFRVLNVEVGEATEAPKPAERELLKA